MVRSGNPALSDRVFGGQQQVVPAGTPTMTVAGTTQKTGILIGCCLLTATYVWQLFMSGTGVTGLMLLGAIGGFGVAILTAFKQELAPYTAPVYALLEGLFLGGISAQLNSVYEGIAIQAVMLTLGTAGILLLGFMNGYITVNDRIRSITIAATGGILVVYLLSFVLGFVGIHIPYIHGNGIIGIGFSLVVVVVASLNLLMDYDLISRKAESGAPKYMEWYGAFALMVTIVWLYIEFLRLLAKLKSRR